MSYTWTVKDKDYELKLTMKRLRQLEQKLGKNPLLVFTNLGDGAIPSTSDMIDILWASIQNSYACTDDIVCDLLDDWMEEGHEYTDLVTLVVDVFRTSGLIKEEQEEETKGKNTKAPKQKK